MSFTEIDSDHLSRYLNDFALGKLDLDLNKQQQKKRSTVTQARDVLRRLFENLRREGIRADNPMDSVPDVLVDEGTPSTPIASAQEREKWHQSYNTWLNSPAPEFGMRANSERSNALAVFVYWTSLQRSELAKAKMADIRSSGGNQWFIWVENTQKSTRTKILIPTSAMKAIQRYRISRGLPEIPGDHETDVPLFARKNTERALDPWTIAHILKSDAPEMLDGIRYMQTSISRLRKAFVADGVLHGVPEFEIGQHIRSHHVVRHVAAQVSTGSFGESIAKMQTALTGALP